MWAVEGVCYVADLDDLQLSSQRVLNEYNDDDLDIHHARWAATSAITALDLCAAVLGRRHCSVTGSNEFDLGFFNPTPPTTGKPTKAQNRFAQLPPAAQGWVRDVLADADYQMVLDARDPFVHRRLLRIVHAGVGTANLPRTAFRIGPKQQEVDSRDLIERARRVAVEHVERFLTAVVAGRV
jgi:hypothetical protein